MNAPYLSIVVTARNDDHGGSLLPRMQTFVNALLDQCREQSFEAELIIVEWNPPPDRPRLAEALRWNPSPCRVRVIEVPESLHRGYRHADLLPLYQMIAKNVGIRRALGEFILATNIDILFSNELIQFAVRHGFRKGVLYRLDRHDVAPDVPVDVPVAERLAFCETHRIRIFAREGSFALDPDGCYVANEPDVTSGELPMRPRLRMGWFEREFENGEPFRWAGNRAELLLPKESSGTLILDLEPGPGVRQAPFDLEIEGSGKLRIEKRSIVKVPLTGDLVAFRVHGGGHVPPEDPRVLNFRMFTCEVTPEAVPAASVEPKEILQELPPEPPAPPAVVRRRKTSGAEPVALHTYACGDFTLMAREHWMDVRGYAELDMYSMHLDSLLCWAAHYAGVREEVLEDPLRTYHIDHSVGSGWTPEGGAQLFARLENKGVPSLEYSKLLEWVTDMRELGVTMVLNHDGWGHASETLTETEYSGHERVSGVSLKEP
jgi:hypothetical protein